MLQTNFIITISAIIIRDVTTDNKITNIHASGRKWKAKEKRPKRKIIKKRNQQYKYKDKKIKRSGEAPTSI